MIMEYIFPHNNCSQSNQSLVIRRSNDNIMGVDKKQKSLQCHAGT